MSMGHSWIWRSWSMQRTLARMNSWSWSRQTLSRRGIHTSASVLKTIPSNLKGKSKSSQEWLTRQLNDPYVKKAQEMNLRARSAFKLIEIDDKARILKPGQTVIECGAAPGAWTQVIVERINSDRKVGKKRTGTVIGIDLLPIAPLDGAIFLGGYDFTSDETLKKIQLILQEKIKVKEEGLQGRYNGDDLVENLTDDNNATGVTGEGGKSLLVDVVLSDMAPNASGQRDTDHPRIIKLVESALMFALRNGREGGHFLAKVWDGSEVKRVESVMSKYYEKVSRYKPKASRSDSSEMFVLGRFKK